MGRFKLTPAGQRRSRSRDRTHVDNPWGNWDCPGCGFHNFGRNWSCKKCKERKPSDAPKQDIKAAMKQQEGSPLMKYRKRSRSGGRKGSRRSSSRARRITSSKPVLKKRRGLSVSKSRSPQRKPNRKASRNSRSPSRPTSRKSPGRSNSPRKKSSIKKKRGSPSRSPSPKKKRQSRSRSGARRRSSPARKSSRSRSRLKSRKTSPKTEKRRSTSPPKKSSKDDRRRRSPSPKKASPKRRSPSAPPRPSPSAKIVWGNKLTDFLKQMPTMPGLEEKASAPPAPRDPSKPTIESKNVIGGRAFGKLTSFKDKPPPQSQVDTKGQPYQNFYLPQIGSDGNYTEPPIRPQKFYSIPEGGLSFIMMMHLLPSIDSEQDLTMKDIKNSFCTKSGAFTQNDECRAGFIGTGLRNALATSDGMRGGSAFHCIYSATAEEPIINDQTPGVKISRISFNPACRQWMFGQEKKQSAMLDRIGAELVMARLYFSKDCHNEISKYSQHDFPRPTKPREWKAVPYHRGRKIPIESVVDVVRAKRKTAIPAHLSFKRLIQDAYTHFETPRPASSVLYLIHDQNAECISELFNLNKIKPLNKPAGGSLDSLPPLLHTVVITPGMHGHFPDRLISRWDRLLQSDKYALERLDKARAACIEKFFLGK